MNLTLHTPQERARTALQQSFGCVADVAARAPARVNLIGEHTDYNEGYAMPCAIDRETVVAAAARDDDLIEVIACDLGGEKAVFRAGHAADVARSPQWLRYVRGMVAVLTAQGLPIGGASLAIAGNVPRGAGVSSSASLEMALGQAFQQLNGWGLSPTLMALAGQRAENEFAGCQCGVLDQLASACGQQDHALLLDCRSLHVEAIALPEDLAVLVIDSRIQRGLVDTAYNLRRQQCQAAARGLGVSALRDVTDEIWAARAGELDAVVRMRARHIVSDSRRCLELAAALHADDRALISRLMRESHGSMRDDFQITVPAIDALALLLQQVLGDAGGARMTGGGFGGCLVALAPKDAIDAVVQAVDARYRSPGGEAAVIHVCRAADGARVLA